MSQNIVQKQTTKGLNIYSYKDCVLKPSIKKLIKLKTTDYKKHGKFPIIDQGKEFIAGYTDIEASLLSFNQPIIVFGDHTLNIKYIDFPFARGADGTQIIIPNQNIVSPKFFYYLLKSTKMEAKHYERYFKYIKKMSFTLPTLPEQNTIVAKLDKKMAQVETMKKEAEKEEAALDIFFTSELKSIFNRHSEKWVKKKIRDILSIEYGKSLNGNVRVVGDIPVYGSNGIIGKHNNHLIDFDTIIIGRKGSAGELNLVFGKSWPIDTTYYIRTKYNLKFIFYLLKNLDLTKIKQKGVKPGLNREELYDLDILFTDNPEEQNKIVTELTLIEKEINNQRNFMEQKYRAILQLPEATLNEIFNKKALGV